MEQKRKAFTLIELMAVIMVIAILIGIGIPRIRGMQEEALIVKVQGELKTIQAGIESYYVHLVPNAFPDTSSTVIQDYLLDASPQIVSDIYLDPFHYDCEDEYTYIKADAGPYYVIFSIGPDGVPDIEGIDDEGVLTGEQDDDIFVTNGEGWGA